MAKRPVRTLEQTVHSSASETQPDPLALVRAYRWMLIARQVDDTMWTLRRQGKGHFVVSSAGHEAIGGAAGAAVDPQHDFLAPHYRDLAACLAWGLQPRE